MTIWSTQLKPVSNIEYLATEILDFLVTEDNDYLITNQTQVFQNELKASSVWTNTSK